MAADGLVSEGMDLLARDPADGPVRRFRVAAAGNLAGRAIHARDRDDGAAQQALVARATGLLAPLVDGPEGPLVRSALAIAAQLHELSEDPARALQMYLGALEDTAPDDVPEPVLVGVLRTGVLTGRHDVVLRYAQQGLEASVRRYATEPDPGVAQALQVQLDRDLENVARSCAATGDLGLLLTALELTSSARLRYRMTIRQGPAGRRIRRLESDLWNAERGLEDGGGIRRLPREGRAVTSLSALSRLREAHRLEADRHRAELVTPSRDEVRAWLRPDEGAAVLAAGSWGTAVLLLTRPRGEERRGEERRGEQEPDPGEVLTTPRNAWLDALGPEPTPGWAFALGLPWDYDGLEGADRRAALERALAAADEEVAPRLATWASGLGLQRIWVIAHGLLGLIPWWAAPSLRRLDIRPAPTLSMLPRARGAARLGGPALVVGNATDDLPAAEAEAAAVGARLRERGVEVTALAGAGSTQDVVTLATGRARILHFSGHATSELTDSTRSALHLHPDPRWSGPGLGDELIALAEAAGLVRRGDGGDGADGADGADEDGGEAEVQITGPDGARRTAVLTEEPHTGGIRLRRLEYSQTGTLFTAFADGRLVRSAELWSAGDMAVSGALRGLRLAVLSACQSGGGALAFGSDELGGLPAAMLLAGVRSIVCTAWTVDDVLGAVTSDLLWELLCAQGDRTVDLYAVVNQVRATLAAMPADEARRRITHLRSAAPPGRARFRLEAAAAGLGSDPPYARPYEWAPLYVVGEPLLTWRKP